MTPYINAVWSVGPIYDTVTGPISAYGGAYQTENEHPNIQRPSWVWPPQGYVRKTNIRGFCVPYPNITTLELVFKNTHNELLVGTERLNNLSGQVRVTFRKIGGGFFPEIYCIDNGANNNSWSGGTIFDSYLTHPVPIGFGEVAHVVAEVAVGSHVRFTVNGHEIVATFNPFPVTSFPDWDFGRSRNASWTIYYSQFELLFAAIYDKALTPEQVAHHHALLFSEDEITGTAIMTTGAPVEKVLILMEEARRIVSVTPRSNGSWYARLPKNQEFYLAYLVAGCPPHTHGPYRIDS
ncbi:MAG: hypothetical protein EA420_03115 [Candidatus Competibacteraceae bacterium]|nr:MAG: hypothetical protein EA420_03115 [Candidatus Competibacteraceae bacterium]